MKKLFASLVFLSLSAAQKDAQDILKCYSFSCGALHNTYRETFSSIVNKGSLNQHCQLMLESVHHLTPYTLNKFNKLKQDLEKCMHEINEFHHSRSFEIGRIIYYFKQCLSVSDKLWGYYWDNSAGLNVIGDPHTENMWILGSSKCGGWMNMYDRRDRTTPTVIVAGSDCAIRAVARCGIEALNKVAGEPSVEWLQRVHDYMSKAQSFDEHKFNPTKDALIIGLLMSSQNCTYSSSE